MRTVSCQQGTAEWLQARCGKETASRMVDVLAMLKKGGESAARRNYRMELVAERLSGRTEDHYVSSDMARGSELEPIARSAYEVGTGEIVDTVGFVLHPALDHCGASPDGLVGADGALEIKCPRETTHLQWIDDNKVPEEHLPQCIWVMACTGRAWCDFVSYCPGLPDGLRVFIVRVPRDEALIADYEAKVESFEREVDEQVQKLRSRIILTPPKPVDTRSELEQLEAMMDAIELIP